MGEILANIFMTITVLGIAILIYLFIIGVNFLFAKSLPKDTVIAITGGLGQGKSLIGVTLSCKKIKRSRLLWGLGYLNQKEIPLLYSNIPITFRNGLILRALVKRKWLTIISVLTYFVWNVLIWFYSFNNYEFVVSILTKFIVFIFVSFIYFVLWKILAKGSSLEKQEMSVMLKYEHITYIERQNEYNVTYIDEIGHFASQWDYDNPLVMIYLQEYVRFYRHVYDGTLIYNDQSSENVAKPIRVRTNKIYNLIDFHRTWLFFYKVSVVEMMIGEDIDTTYSNQLDNPPYYFGHLPFKWFKFLDVTRLLPFVYKKYESRVHKPLYDHVEHKKIDLWDNSTLYNEIKYLIELPQNQTIKRKYQREGYIGIEKMLEFIEEQKQIRKKMGTQTMINGLEIEEIGYLRKRAKSIKDSIKHLQEVYKDYEDFEIYNQDEHIENMSKLVEELEKTNIQIIELVQKGNTEYKPQKNS